MEENDKESKTEDPSEKKIKDSVSEGKIPYSREISTAATLLAISGFFMFNGLSTITTLTKLLTDTAAQSVNASALTNDELVHILWNLGIDAILVLAPFLVSLIIAALVSSIAQNELRFVVKRISPQYSRISVIAGWKRMFSMQAIVEFLKSLAKISGAATVVLVATSSTVQDMVSTMFYAPTVSLLTISNLVGSTFAWVAGTATVIALADLAWQRHSWWVDIKMSRQELKDEFKQADGDPLIKSRIRALGRERARSKMINSVPSATLIVANPTHYAIALRYDAGHDAAPVVVAKGMNILALRIRQIAETNSIPVFERVELARALYKSVNVDQVIPAQFYRAIAELVRMVYDKRI